MSIAIDLKDDELEARLVDLCKKTKRSKSFFAREAIRLQLDDLEDYYLGIEISKNPGRIYSAEDVRKMCGLDD